MDRSTRKKKYVKRENKRRKKFQQFAQQKFKEKQMYPTCIATILNQITQQGKKTIAIIQKTWPDWVMYQSANHVKRT